MTTVEETRINGLLAELRDAEADWRRGYARVLRVVAALGQEKPVTGFSTTAQMLAAVLNLSKGEAGARAEQAQLLSPRRSLTGEVLPPTLPATAAELAAGVISPAQLRVITATMRRIPSGIHPEAAAQAEETLAYAARRFDPAALVRIGERLRRLACDCGVVPMVLGSESMPLDVGREQRLATTALREALAQRDQGCAFPACTRSPRYCHAHHIRSWLDLGDTALHNMCLLCEYHHTIVHRQGWQIKLNARGHPEFIPPATVSPTRQPLHDPLRQ